ncbi:MAG: NRDE family protein [Burkholderiales bacterium]|nr:NRDE family protein [Burkholderiales bacterium]
MCLVAVALGAHPRYAVVVAANRDEFHDRAASAAHWWDAGWIAGRDLAAGGTWLGVRRDGRWSLVTNVREPGRQDAAAATRGELPIRALSAPDLPEFLGALRREDGRYNGYNLLAGDRAVAHWTSNRHGPARRLPRGVSAIANAALDTPWPKVERLRAALGRWTDDQTGDLDPLFAALADRTVAPDERLPATGVPLERERMLSAAFIVSERYGTRASTVYALGVDGTARLVERTFDPAGRLVGEVDERFTVPVEDG